MNWLKNWLGAGKRTRKGSASRGRTCHLSLERLEARDVPTVLFHPAFGLETEISGSANNAMISPNVYLIYSGGWNNTAQGKADMATLNGAFQSLLSPKIRYGLKTSTYLSGLIEYGSDGKANSVYPGSFTDPRTIPLPTDASGKTTYAHASDVQSFLQTWITNNNAAPTASDWRHTSIYVVISDPSSSGQFAAGWNDGGVYKQGSAAKNIEMIWMGTRLTGAGRVRHVDLDTATQTFSHELVEAISDPGQTGIHVRAGSALPAALAGANQIGDNEPVPPYQLHYSYRLNGIVVQPYWSRMNQAFIVPDGLAQQINLWPQWIGSTFTGAYQLDVGQTSAVAIDPFSTAGFGLSLNGLTYHFDTGGITSFTVGGAGTVGSLANGTSLSFQNGQVNILSTSASTYLQINTENFTDFVVGDSRYGTDNIRGSFSIQNSFGEGNLFVNDRAGRATTLWKQYSINENTVHLQQNANINYSGLSYVTLDPTTRLAAQVEVDGCLASTLIEIDAASMPTVVSAYFDTADGHQILGNVLVLGNAQTEVDTFDLGGPNTYTIRDNTVGEEGRGNVFFLGVGKVGVVGESGGNTFNIYSTDPGVVTDVYSVTGTDKFVVMDDNSTLDSIQGALNLHGSAGIFNQGTSSVLVVDDSLNPAGQTFTVTTNQVTRTGMAPITFDTMAEVDVVGSSLAAATFNILSVAPTVFLNLSVGAGSTVNIGSPATDLTDIGGPVSVSSFDGTATVVIDDSTDTTAHDITAEDTGNGKSLIGLTPGSLTFDGFTAGQVTVIPGSGDLNGLDAFFALLGN